MGRKSSIDALPADLQEELKHRLYEWGFTGYEAHEAWLAELGYQVSRSSIHRLGKLIESADHAELRVRCLDIASRYSSADTILANATALVRWVKPPRS